LSSQQGLAALEEANLVKEADFDIMWNFLAHIQRMSPTLGVKVSSTLPILPHDRLCAVELSDSDSSSVSNSDSDTVGDVDSEEILANSQHTYGAYFRLRVGHE
jgi:hypothetical protein